MTRRRLTPEDLFRYRLPSSLVLAPNGERVVAVVSRVHPDRKQNRYQRDLWLFNTAIGHGRRIWKEDHDASSPRFSPDGSRLLFLGTFTAGKKRSAGQLWVADHNGRKPKRIALGITAISDPQWSPDGAWIGFIAAVEEPQPTPHARHIHRLSYRMDSGGYHHTYRRHLFLVRSTGGRAQQITKGAWSVEDFHWGHDAREILFVANRSEDTRTRERELLALRVASGKISKLCALRGGLSRPVPSRDGRTIALLGDDFHAGQGTNTNLYLYTRKHRRLQNLSRHFDLSIEASVNSDSRVASPYPGPVWSIDGTSLRFLASQRGSTQLFSLHVSSKKVEPLTAGPHTIDTAAWSADQRRAALILMTPTQLPEIWIREAKQLQQLSNFNTALLRTRRLSTPNELLVRTSDGKTVQGWYLAPTSRTATRRGGCSAILHIHGGPRTAYGMGFMSEFHLLAAAGHAVFYVNPRGSSSYGERWAQGVCGHYGERDYRDLMEAVQAVRRTFPVDPRRLGVTGGSYGGFMTNWIIGHTQRFRAALSHRSISNFVSFFGTSDIGWRFAHDEVGGFPWQELQRYWKHSPLAYVNNMHTPLLIMHAEDDFRCPVEQAEQLYTALQVLGREVEFIRFPGESHEMTRSGRPQARLANVNAVIAWFSKHLG